MHSSQAEIIQHNQQKYFISGTVNFTTAPDLLRQSSCFFKADKTSDNERVIVDLSKIEDCNSAALALMFELVKNAKDKNVEIHFENLPESLLSIAKAYGVQDEIREFSQ